MPSPDSVYNIYIYIYMYIYIYILDIYIYIYIPRQGFSGFWGRACKGGLAGHRCHLLGYRHGVSDTGNVQVLGADLVRPGWYLDVFGFPRELSGLSFWWVRAAQRVSCAPLIFAGCTVRFACFSSS